MVAQSFELMTVQPDVAGEQDTVAAIRIIVSGDALERRILAMENLAARAIAQWSSMDA